MKILPLSTINDNRTILQEVLRIRKYLEENPCRNVFHIDEDYDDGTVAYDKTKVFIPLDFDGSVEGGDVIIFKNSYIAVLDTVSTDYVVIKADTAVTIRGAKGDTGATGATGNGISGIVKTGTVGLVDTYTIAFTNGTSATFTVTNGKDGENGATGATGNGISSITKTGTSGLVDTYTIAFTNGTSTTFTVTNGANGQNGVGVPTGGTTGQVLKKKSNTDYDTEWGDESGGGGSGIIQLSDNLLINPDFVINQRGITSLISATAKYGADRWYCPVENTGARFRDNNAELSGSSKLIQFVEGYGKKLNGGYFLAVVEAELSEGIIGKPTVDIKIGNTTLTPIDDGEKMWYSDIELGYGKYQYWALYSIIELGQTGAVSNGTITFVINGDSTVTQTNVSNSGLFVLDNEPDNITYVNIPKVNPSIELEKCKYYFENIKKSSVNLPCIVSAAGVDNNANCTSITFIGGFSFTTKRVIPTISSNPTISYLFYSIGSASSAATSSTTTAINEITKNFCTFYKSMPAGSYAYLPTAYISTTGSDFNDLRIDAEIYP